MKATYIDMALEILRTTNDGNDLARVDLSVLQSAVNGWLSEQGEIYFVDLYRRVSSGTYRKPWLHGVENLTKDHEGYVYWRDIEVEHYSFRDAKREKEAAEELGDRCRYMEMMNFPVTTTSVIWQWEKYAQTRR